MHFRALLPIPNYLEMNYVLLALSILSYPKNEEFTHPFLSKLSLFDKFSFIRQIR